MTSRSYPSDLTDEQWLIVEPYFVTGDVFGRPPKHDLRLVVNAILYQSRTGCQWRYLPSEFPPRSTVHGWFVKWRRDGTWDQVLDDLRGQARNQAGHDTAAGAAVLDAQSVPNAGPAEEVGYDAGKKIRGRKRHIIVDSLGLLIGVLVTSAYVSDLAGGYQLLRKTMLTNSMLGLVRCDSGYQGLAKRAARLRVRIEIVKNPSRHQFVPVRHRWIVERSLAWLSAHRRLGKRDLEHTIEAAEAWVKVAAIASMLDRLAPKPGSPQALTSTP